MARVRISFELQTKEGQTYKRRQIQMDNLRRAIMVSARRLGYKIQMTEIQVEEV